MKNRTSIMGCVLTAVALLVMLASVAPANAGTFLVDIYGQGVHAWGWVEGDIVTMNIYDFQGGTSLCEDTQTFPHGGEGVNFNLSGCPDVLTGNYVEVTGGGTTKTHLVAGVALTEVDIAGNTVAGTLDPSVHPQGMVGLQVVTTAFPWTNIYTGDDVQADASTGEWEIDVTGQLLDPPGDLIAGMYVEAMWGDADGDSTRYGWGPSMNVAWEYNYVHTWGWPPGVDVTLEVYDQGVKLVCTNNTQESPPGGQGFDFNVGCDIQPGHLVTLSATTSYIGTASHTVTNLTVDCVGATDGFVTGTAEPDSDVLVHSGGEMKHVIVEADGRWVAGPFISHVEGQGVRAENFKLLDGNTQIDTEFTLEACVSIPVEIEWAHVFRDNRVYEPGAFIGVTDRDRMGASAAVDVGASTDDYEVHLFTLLSPGLVDIYLTKYRDLGGGSWEYVNTLPELNFAVYENVTYTFELVYASDRSPVVGVPVKTWYIHSGDVTDPVPIPDPNSVALSGDCSSLHIEWEDVLGNLGGTPTGHYSIRVYPLNSDGSLNYAIYSYQYGKWALPEFDIPDNLCGACQSYAIGIQSRVNITGAPPLGGGLVNRSQYYFRYDTCYTNVNIDIKPGSDSNCIKVSKKGVTPVAILSTSSIDLTSIDVTTIEIGDDDDHGGGFNCVKSSIKKDVNKDGVPDCILQFSTPELADILVDGNLLYITGTLSDDTEFLGSDVIHLAGESTLCN